MTKFYKATDSVLWYGIYTLTRGKEDGRINHRGTGPGNLDQGQGFDEAKRYGVTAVPGVVVEGKLLDCCQRAHPTEHDLKAAGIRQPLR